MDAIEILLPYQKAWIRDTAKVKVWEKSRRIGASYAEALASVLEAAKSKEAGGQSSYYLSYSKEMTQQFVKDAAFWAKHINAAAEEIEEVAIQDEDKDITVYRIRFTSGFEIWGLPSTARALRSKQGRVIIDEAAFVEDLGELLKAAIAMQIWGGCVRILSTHNGDDSQFNELVKDIREGKKRFSLHRTTFDEALAQGLHKQICLVEKEEKRVKEFDKWLRHEVRDILLAHTNPVYMGEDFGRSGDLTCIFFDEQMPDGRLATFLVIELRNVPFAQQWQTIKYAMDTLPNLGGAAFDGRGNGQMIAEYAAQEWPGYVHQVMITTKWYSENFPGLKGAMEDGMTTIPEDPFIRDDFRVVGLKAGVPCVLERSGGPRERRHGDGAIAKLMAYFAAQEDDAKGYQPMTYEAVETPNRFRGGKKDTWDDLDD
jgi:phage FluMu gp28-like protein